ncbi:MAG: ABC transporter permease [Planctomycetota bacterium]
MGKIWAIASKDLRLLSRDKMAVFFILGFPMLMGLFFGTIMGGPSSGGGAKKTMKLAVVDNDDTEMSKSFIERLKENDNLDISSATREEAMDSVRKGKLLGMLVLGEGFGETAGIPWKDAPEIEVGMDPSRTAESAMVEGFLMQTMGALYGDRLFNADAMRPNVDQLRQQLKDQRDDVPENLRPAYSTLTDSLDGLFDSLDRIQEGDELSDEEPSESAEADEDDDFQPSMQFANITSIDVTRELEKGSRAEVLSRIRSKWDITFPQCMVWGILGCVSGFSVSIVREKVRGTFERLEIAPLSKVQILLGKGLGCFIAVTFVILFLSAVGYGLGMRPRSYSLLVLAAVIVAFCFVGIMLVISVIGESEEAVGGAGWGINMVMAMLGGGMVPLMFLPSFMRPLSNLSPVKWAVLSIEGAVWRGFSLTEMLFPLSILIAVGSVCLAFGTYRLSRTL